MKKYFEAPRGPYNNFNEQVRKANNKNKEDITASD